MTARPGRYDVLFMPPSFPFGGMENPCLTFVTPCLLAGDRSLADVIIHEIAHSWFGNLVTSASWGEFWLNEGFTMYAQRRISSVLFGESPRGPVSPSWAHQAPPGMSRGGSAASPGRPWRPAHDSCACHCSCRAAVTRWQGPGAAGVLGGQLAGGTGWRACLPKVRAPGRGPAVTQASVHAPSVWSGHCQPRVVLKPVPALTGCCAHRLHRRV